MEEQIKRITRLLIRKTEGNLTQAETQELEDWLGESAHNRRMLEELENKSLNTRLFTEYLSVHSSRACRNVEKRLGRKTPSRKRMLWGALLGAACSAVLAWLIFLEKNQENPFRDFPVLALMPASSPALHFDLGGGEIILEGTSIEMLDGKMLLQRPGMEPLVIVDTGNNYREQPLHTTIEIPKGTQYSITLENGTRVWLNAETRLKYPLVFRKQAREVELSGEAFFEVAEDRSRPFRVLTTGQTVEVLGTRFNINTCRGECTYTTLLEGSIRISAAGQELFLSPDMEAAVSSKGITTRPVHADRIASWREGLFVLEHRTLEAVMADLAGWYNFTVEYEDEQLKQVSFRGAVPRADHLTEVLDILSLTGEVNFSIRHDKIIVKR